MNIQALVRQAIALTRKHSPLILTGTAVAGVVTTAVLSAKASVKVHEKMNDIDDPQDAPTNRKEYAIHYAKVGWKSYLPALGAGALTVTSIVMIHYTHQKRYAALMGLYVLGEKALAEYQEAVEEVADNKTHEKIKEKVVDKAMSRDEKALEEHLEEQVDNKTLCYDAFSGRYFWSDMETIRRAENNFNQQLIRYGYGTLNEYYTLVGLEGVDAGEDVGWNADELLELDYNSWLSPKGRPALYVGFGRTKPSYNYYRNH